MCENCGVEKFFVKEKCDKERSSSQKITYKEFQDLSRNNSTTKQKELVEVTTSAEELMQKIETTAPAVILHHWEANWGSHQRRYWKHNFKKGDVLYNADFSATMDLNPQDRLNCAIPAHAIQHVFIFALNPRWVTFTNKDGLPYTKRIITNIGFNIWASGNYTLKTNSYLHGKCLRFCFGYLRKKYGRELTQRLYGNTDGCGEQFKSCKNANDISRFCDEMDCDEYVHNFAVTSTFKVNIDAWGGDTKEYISTGEKRENFRCHTCEKVYLQCKNHMPQPKIVSDCKKDLEHCESRIHVYCVDKKDATAAHYKDEFVIITDSVNESWDSSEVRGIKSSYCLRAKKGEIDGDKSVIYMRDHSCYCVMCASGDYESCSQTEIVGKFKKIILKRSVVPKVYENVNIPAGLKLVTQFFYGSILQSTSTIILGVMMLNNDTNERSLMFGALIREPSLIKSLSTVEHTIEKNNYLVEVKSGSVAVKIKLLVKHPDTENKFYIPTNSKTIDFPIEYVIDPTHLLQDNIALNRENYISYITTESSVTKNNKVSKQITYEISYSSLEWLIKSSRCF